MKQRQTSTALVAAALALSAPAGALAQTTCHGRQITTLDFRSPVLISGTALSVGAIYRFSNVATGIDARVRIDALTNSTLAIFDQDAGLIGNFQPELAGTNVRSADFTISFVTAGGTTPVSLDFAASGIDIDGDSASLREYSEFSLPFPVYVLDSPTNLDVNASGPSVPGNVRFESRTTFTAPGIDETATANIVSVLYTGTSSFQYRIGVLGTGSTTRLTSLDFTCPNLPFPAPAPQVTQDFGDAPIAYGNPIHDIVAGIRIGATNTAETAPYNHPTANADAGDDGIVIPAMTQAASATIDVPVTGAGGRLQAWFDWAGDATFATAGDQVATNVADGGAGDADGAVNGNVRLIVAVPLTATLSATFARFRWSTQAGVNATLTAPNGEVQDYSVTINRAFPTLVSAKTAAVYDPLSAGLYAVPGNDVVYTITTQNVGAGSVDSNSMFIVDRLPAEVTFYNADMDGGGPATGPILFTQAAGTGLTFTEATDLRFSNAVPPPANFAACAYTPIAGYDPNVRHVCLNPKGVMLGAPPAKSFSVSFRAQIK